MQNQGRCLTGTRPFQSTLPRPASQIFILLDIRLQSPKSSSVCSPAAYSFYRTLPPPAYACFCVSRGSEIFCVLWFIVGAVQNALIAPYKTASSLHCRLSTPTHITAGYHTRVSSLDLRISSHLSALQGTRPRAYALSQHIVGS